MANIRPEDLPVVPGGVVNPASVLIVDDGGGVWKATPEEIAASALGPDSGAALIGTADGGTVQDFIDASLSGGPFIPDVTPGAMTDQAATINTALTTHSDVQLPSGIIWTDRAVIVPATKRLGMRPDTILKALPTFEKDTLGNCIVLLNGDGAQLIGGTVDANKVGLGGGGGERINGVQANDGVTGYLVQNVTIQNCTGYGRYDAGANGLTTPPGGTNINIRTYNCEVHFEPQGADGVIYIDCHARDGDGDITCLQWFHPLVGSKNISHIGCSGIGVTGAGIEPTGNIAQLENITFSDCVFINDSGGLTLSFTAGTNGTEGFYATNCIFINEGGEAALFSDASGAFTNCRFVGAPVGITSNGSDFDLNGCTVIATSSTGSAAKGISAPSTFQIRMNGGSVTASGTTPIAFEGGVRVSPTTVVSPGEPASVTTRPISSEENIESDKGMKVKGTPIDGSNSNAGELGYNVTNGLYFQAVDRTGGGAVDKGLTFYGTSGVRLNTSTSYALTATFDGTGLVLATGKVLKVGVNQVVGARGAAVADASGGATIDAEARAAINTLLARLRTHGLIAT